MVWLESPLFDICHPFAVLKNTPISFPLGYGLGGDDKPRCLLPYWEVSLSSRWGSFLPNHSSISRVRAEGAFTATFGSMDVSSRTLTPKQVTQDWRDIKSRHPGGNATTILPVLQDISLAPRSQLFAPQFLLPLKSCSYCGCYNPPRSSGSKQEHNNIYSAADCNRGRRQQGQLVSPLLILAWGGLQAGLEGLRTCLAPGREGWDSWGPEQMGLLGHLSKP